MGVLMSNEPRVKKITVTYAKPGSAKYPHGKVGFGYYIIVDGELILTDADGIPAGSETGKKFRHKLQPSESETAIASMLTRELTYTFRDSKAQVSGFEPGPLNYAPKRGWM